MGVTNANDCRSPGSDAIEASGILPTDAQSMQDGRNLSQIFLCLQDMISAHIFLQRTCLEILTEKVLQQRLSHRRQFA